ncbi:hypothetical protein Mapa_003001 [Marchantia paleacea]|nr:hypothetical protein Mapa_003001 [Marchantia paleacea]
MPWRDDLPSLIMWSSRRYLRDSHCPEGDHGNISDPLANPDQRTDSPMFSEYILLLPVQYTFWNLK